MEGVFFSVFHMSLVSSYIIAVVFFIRLLLTRAPKLFSYLLWGIVFIRLICPLSFESVISLVPARVNEVRFEQLVPQVSGNVSENTQTHTAPKENLYDPIYDAVADQSPHLSVNGILAILWIGTAAGLLLYNILSLMALRRKLTDAEPIDRNIYISGHIRTPFVIGLFRPAVYLPAGLTDEEEEYVIRHERVHISRRDYLVKAAAFFITCIHWFNPLVWIAFILMSRDMEMACDERVLREMGNTIKKDYSNSLLSMAIHENGVLSAPLAFGENAVKSRVKNVLRYKKPAFGLILFVTVLCAVSACGLLTDPKGNTATAENTIGAENTTAAENTALAVNTAAAETSAPKTSAPKTPEALAEAWAKAFTDRDGEQISKLLADQKKFEELGGEVLDDGSYFFGWSSPWPWEDDYQIVMGPENSMVIYYNANVSDPHITVWRNDITYTESGGGYLVSDVRFTQYDSVSSAAEFDEAYFRQGEYVVPDYKAKGLTGPLQEQYDTDTNAEYYSPLTKPDYAAQWQLNLTDGTADIVSQGDKEAVVSYRWTDGTVMIQMYQPEKQGEDGIWIVRSVDKE